MSGLAEIEARIAAAAHKAGRDPSDIDLIAVSKVQPIERVEAVLEEGHRLFGENRVQEAQGKWPALRERYGEISLHLIGPLQTNKVKAAMDLFDVIQTLDRNRLAVKIATEAQERGTCPDLYVQVNTGEESQKAGIAPAEADAFIARCREEYDLPVVGVMAIPPADAPPVPHFDLLAQIADRNGLSRLSMGMSADFEEAIANGATAVRVGSAIFGARIPGVPTGTAKGE
jgi:pyridoxal phosphate enzyme (YggS family)